MSEKKAPVDVAQAVIDAADGIVANVYVSDWKFKVRLRSWSAGDRADFDAESDFFREHLDEELCQRLVVARAIAHSMLGSSDSLAFPPPSLNQMRKAIKAAGKAPAGEVLEPFLKPYRLLDAKGAKPTQKLYKIICDLNALTEEAEVELEGN